MPLQISERFGKWATYVRPGYGPAAIAIICLTIVSGIVHGHFSGRWDSTQEDIQAERKLQEFPQRFGSWEQEESMSLTPYAQSVLECRSYLNRRYAHRETGQTVTVAVLVGPPGPISVHTPEICLSSRDYELRGEREPATIVVGEADAHLWKNTFHPTGANARSMRVYYAWNDGTGWKAPKEPRFSFVARRRLYKIQVAASLPLAPEVEDDLCTEFLEQCLPVLEQYLVRPTASP